MDILSINNKNIFIYIVIILCGYLYYKKYDIKLNIIFGLFISICIIYLYQQNSDNQEITQQNIIQEKENSMRLKSEYMKNRIEIKDFIFSIQEIYIYNPQAFEEMDANLNNFFDCYDEIKIDNSVSQERFNDMKLIRRDVLNSLHSIILSIPPANGDTYLKKISEALDKLSLLLNYYITDVYTTANNYIKDHGYNTKMSVMFDSPYMQKNIYDTGTGRYSSIYSYQYF